MRKHVHIYIHTHLRVQPHASGDTPTRTHTRTYSREHLLAHTRACNPTRCCKHNRCSLTLHPAGSVTRSLKLGRRFGSENTALSWTLPRQPRITESSRKHPATRVLNQTRFKSTSKPKSLSVQSADQHIQPSTVGSRNDSENVNTQGAPQTSYYMF